jgi:peptide methionine sulfoxide reductase msrA/msrB
VVAWAVLLLIAGAQEVSVASDKFQKPDKQALKQMLTPEQYHVTQEEGTERAFHNKYWDNHAPGIYVDVVSGKPLFSSLDKYDSGTGWPSFTRPIDQNSVGTKTDHQMFMARTEVHSADSGSHLGHVFDDGPNGGKRFCMNSAAMRFVPLAEMEAQGYGAYLAAFEKAGVKVKTEEALLAGGCFWGVEELIRQLPGVTHVEVGYTGGTKANPTYEDVKTGETGHAESVRIEFDPGKLSYEAILRYFFRLHDPTTKNRQGNDIGTQYRSAIFYESESQKKTAEKVKAEVDKSGKWKKPLTTEIVAAGKFWSAEEYHQDYLQKHPNGYTCHYLRD